RDGLTATGGIAALISRRPGPFGGGLDLAASRTVTRQRRIHEAQGHRAAGIAGGRRREHRCSRTFNGGVGCAGNARCGGVGNRDGLAATGGIAALISRRPGPFGGGLDLAASSTV